MRAEAGKKKEHEPDEEETLEGTDAPVPWGPGQAAPHRHTHYSR
jgi:hypothetical protein